MEFKTLVTKTGLAKIANATVLGTKVDLKYMAFGDGGGDYPDINEDMTQLVGEKYRGEINNVEVIDNNNIKISKVIPANIGGFFVREIGVFDTDKDLIAIGLFPQTYKPSIEEGATKDVMANMIISVANTSSIILKIDPNVIVATLKDLEDLRDEIGDGTITDLDNNNKFRLVTKGNVPYLRVEEVSIHE